MIRAVTFDLWGTLVRNSGVYDTTLQSKRIDLIYSTLKGEISREIIGEAMRKSWVEIESIRSTLRDVPTSEQLRIVQKFLNTNTDLEKPYTEAVFFFPPTLNPCTENVLKNLKTKIGLISNTGRTPGKVLRTVLAQMGISEYFDATIFSNEVGYLKPHPGIFRKASELLGIPLSEILHVGDDSTCDVEGARAVGMQALHIKELTDLEKVLELV